MRLMRVFQVTAPGIDNLRLNELPVPELATGQVLVQMRAFSLNYRDLRVIEGQYNPKMKLPLVPLSDGSGEVVAVGPGVSRVKAGDRVTGSFMQSWIEGELNDEKYRSALGGAIDGVAGEYSVFNEHGLVHIPDYLSFEEAATLPCAAVTAWNAMFETGDLKSGESVLALGTGGVSTFALQFGRLAGARVIVTSSSDSKIARARDLGAHETINYTANPDWEKQVRQLTDGRGVDHIIEVGGAGTLGKSMRAVRMAGTISLIGLVAQGSDVNPVPILMRNLRVQGIYVGSRTMFENMLHAMVLKQLRPVIDRVFAFPELPAALRYMQEAKHLGKICLTIR
jgi:NADPH:quinone reductase-like Zn-dependent oxidoreductase